MIRVVVDPGVFISALIGRRGSAPERVRRHATVVADPAQRPTETRDGDDDYLVALERQQAVDAIVSGDRDLVDADSHNSTFGLRGTLPTGSVDARDHARPGMLPAWRRPRGRHFPTEGVGFEPTDEVTPSTVFKTVHMSGKVPVVVGV